MIITFSLWGLAGLATFCKCIWEEGELTLDDIKMIPLLILLGPIPEIAVLFDSHKNMVIWKKSTPGKEGK